jgi:hypothetical protein
VTVVTRWGIDLMINILQQLELFLAKRNDAMIICTKMLFLKNSKDVTHNHHTFLQLNNVPYEAKYANHYKYCGVSCNFEWKKICIYRGILLHIDGRHVCI